MSVGTPTGAHTMFAPSGVPGRYPLKRNSMPSGKGVKRGIPANTNRRPPGPPRPPVRGAVAARRAERLSRGLSRALTAVALAGAVYEAWKPYEPASDVQLPTRQWPNRDGWVREGNGWRIPGKNGFQTVPDPVFVGTITETSFEPDVVNTPYHHYGPRWQPRKGSSYIEWLYGWYRPRNSRIGFTYPLTEAGAVADALADARYRWHNGTVYPGRNAPRVASDVAVLVTNLPPGGVAVVPDTPAGRPPKGVKERKYRSGKGWVSALLSTITETADLWNAVLEASGWKYVDRQSGAGWWDRNPDLEDSRFWQQWDWLIDDGHWRDIDGDVLLRELVKNAIEDFFVAKFNQTGNAKWLDAMERFGFSRPVGPTTGPLF